MVISDLPSYSAKFGPFPKFGLMPLEYVAQFNRA
jgi:hypothetical protein